MTESGGLNVILYMCLYLAAMVVIGIGAMKMIKTQDDFWVAGRKLGLPVATGTYLATFISGSSAMGIIGLHYRFGYSILWIYVGSIFTSIVLVALFAHKIRQFGQYTIGDIIGARFGNAARGIAAILIVIAMIFALGVQFIVIGVVLQVVLGLNLQVGIIIGAVFTLLYVAAGGFLADALTDFVQGWVIIAGIAIATPFALTALGGIGELHQKAAAVDPKLLTGFFWAGKTAIPLFILTQLVAWGLGNASQPHFLNRFYGAKDPKVALWSAAIAGILFVPFFIVSNWVGLAGRVLIPGVANPDRIYPLLMTKLLPPVVSSIMVSGIMAAVMSTADSIVLTGSTAVSRDFYQVLINPKAKPEQLVKITRWVIVILGIGGLIFAMWYPTLVTLLNMYIFGAVAATFFSSLVGAFFWKRTTTPGVIASLLIGAGVTILWISLKNPYVHSSIAGTFFSALTLIVVSLLTTPQPEEQATKLMRLS